MSTKIKIARITTIPEAFVHIRGLFKLLSREDSFKQKFELELITSFSPYQEGLKNEFNLKVINVEICREIKFLKDLKALINLYFLFRKNKYAVVHSSTPKAGLVVSLAGFLARVPVRLHTFTGQRWATIKGPMRTLLKFLDRLIIKLNTEVYADSFSQIAYLERESVAKAGQVKCILNGSYGGVDLQRFDLNLYTNSKSQLREELNLKSDDIIYLFVGRLTRDKGINELVNCFATFGKGKTNVHLLLVGPFEFDLDPLEENTMRLINHSPQIHAVGFKKNPEYYMAGSDVFVLPSYREGFGTVVLEAGAMGLPTIGSRIPGLTDAIVDGETGVFFELRSSQGLVEALEFLYRNENIRKNMGERARYRVNSKFDSELISKEVLAIYESLVEASKK